MSYKRWCELLFSRQKTLKPKARVGRRCPKDKDTVQIYIKSKSAVPRGTSHTAGSQEPHMASSSWTGQRRAERLWDQTALETRTHSVALFPSLPGHSVLPLPPASWHLRLPLFPRKCLGRQPVCRALQRCPGEERQPTRKTVRAPEPELTAESSSSSLKGRREPGAHFLSDFTAASRGSAAADTQEQG